MIANESVVFVTGANRGIGKAIVEGYLAAGAKRIYAAARKTADLAPVVALDPNRIVPVELDVTKPGQIEAAAEFAKDVNVLINNAGVGGWGRVLDLSPSDISINLEVNYFGLIAVTKAFAPVIERSGGGTVANILSVASFIGVPSGGAYAASKAAAWSITQSLRSDLAHKGINVIGVFPGPIDTDMAAGIDMEKTPPSVVASEVIAGITGNAEDVFPDPVSKQVYAGWTTDHKAVERQFASFGA